MPLRLILQQLIQVSWVIFILSANAITSLGVDDGPVKWMDILEHEYEEEL